MHVTAPISLTLLAIGMVLSACGPSDSETVARSGQVVSVGEANIGGPYTLVDQSGETRTEADFIGKPQLIYFGFAYCPDVCPTSLQRMGAISERIDPEGDDLHYLFITVDPERDTPDVLDSYVSSNGFAPGLVGLTGDRPSIEAAQQAYKVYAQKRVDDASAADYLYDHTDYIFVMNAEGKFHDIIWPDDSVSAAAAKLKSTFRLR